MRYALVAATVGLGLALSACGARGQVHVGVGMDREGLQYFEMAMADVYGMPAGPLPSYIYPDELPVVYLLAREAGVSPEVVMALREQGWSWMDITYHLGVDPYLYVSRLPRQAGYWGYRGRDYRYLTDRHIIDYVNLYFWADYHRRPITQIIVIRQRVPTWTYYVHYHAPRVVYVRGQPRYNPPPRTVVTAPREDTQPRRAQPRTSTTERATPPNARSTPSVPSRSEAQPSRATVPSRTTTQPSRTATPPSRATTPSRPATQPSRATTPSRPATQPSTRATTPSRPAATPSRTAPSRPTTQAPRPTPQTSRPAATSRPTQSRPAAQPSRTTTQSRPAAQSSSRTPPSRPSTSRPSGSRPNND
jgi:hypothetical protein